MKYLDEYRDAGAVRTLQKALARSTTRPWTLMEICGGQTHSIVRFGLDELLPPALSLVHGPGCPVCVTPIEALDRALALAARRDVVLCSFGDMLRVPGSRKDLLAAKAEGADVRVLYSPADALAVARREPRRQVVFLAVGFETTAPATALTVHRARQDRLHNFSLLVCHVLVPPALRALLGAPDNRVQGVLAAGHVCTVTGYEEYEPLAHDFHVPIVVTGFEPVDLLRGVLLCVQQLEAGRARVENAYARCVRREGSAVARALLDEVFVPVDRVWRGLGALPRSGLRLAPAWAEFDAEVRFPELAAVTAHEAGDCQAGAVLRGRLKPSACPAFGTTCTPESPLGAPMVSSEGACAAYFRYRRTPSADCEVTA